MAKESREIARQEREPSGLMPWRPFAEIARWEREMDRMLGGVLGGRPGSLFEERLHMREPAVDLYENKDEIVVKAELPGMTKDDIEVNITDHLLVLKGEKKKEEEVKEKDYYRSERVYGSFARSIPLPTETEPEKVSATFKNGVLEVHLPKTEEAKKKEIKINVQEEGGQAKQSDQGKR
jgi:HSP20 family protein